MRQALKTVLSVLTVAVLSGLFANLAHSQSGLTPHSFDYTGALFGYYQINEEGNANELYPVRLFFDKRKETQGELLLGMGDNFGPEFRASIQPEDSYGRMECRVRPDPGEYPKAIYKNDTRFPTIENIGCDNVAKFLIAAKYTAIVPGREDFMYSALWLRHMALGLQYQKSGSRPLMLAANLRVKWIYQGAQPDKGNKKILESCPLFFAHADKIFSTDASCSPSVNAAPNTPDTIQTAEHMLDASQAGTKDQDLTAKSESGLGLEKLRKELEGVGYTIVDQNLFRTLIIGVVGSETMSAVSPGNLHVCSEVVAIDTDLQGKQTKSCDPDNMHFKAGEHRLYGTVTVLDPLPTVFNIMRALSIANPGKPFDRVIVMAQMPRTEAEEMAAELRKQLLRSKVEIGPIVVLSEAQQDHVSPDLDVEYDSRNLIPVLTPHPAYNTYEQDLYGPISNASLTIAPQGAPSEPKETAHLSNRPYMDRLENDARKSDWLPSTTDGLLLKQLASLTKDAANNPAAELFASSSSLCDAEIDQHPDKKDVRETCRHALSQFLLRRIQQKSRADAVFLEHRDIFFDPLPEGYDGYTICDGLVGSQLEHCTLGVALDRVLWKGDFEQRVMVAGKDIVALLKTSQQLSNNESSLAAKDVSGQWLTTFGIVKPGLKWADSHEKEFSVPADPDCTVASPAESAFCINGTPIVNDAAYWITTSDTVATDTVVYKVLQAEIPDYVQPAEKFLTEQIAGSLLPSQPASAKVEATGTAITKQAEVIQQARPLYHVDLAKLVVGYSGRYPEGGNSYVANNFQGAANSVAATPSQSEFDLEGQSRFSVDLPIHLKWINDVLPSGIKLISVGVQNDLEYDHTVAGNITGKPVNGVYALNSFSAGGFLQFRLWDLKWEHFVVPHPQVPTASKSLPRALLVIAPRQFQTQVNGGYLFFSYSANTCSLATSACEFTLHLPKATSFIDKVGIRLESGGGPWWKVDRGSYAEFGFQDGPQNNVLSGLTLIGNGIPFTCLANTTVPITQCFSNYGKTNKSFTIDANTQAALPVMTTRLNLIGAYWDIHAQKGLFKTADKSAPGVNLTVDSKADWFSPKSTGRTLSTAEVYAIPLSAAVNFPILRNVSLSPTFSVFLYQAQLTGAKLQTNTFSISAKWYFAHDASVRPGRQLVFQGPASSDQTKTSKIK